jgi:dihydropteroate synthase
MVMGILNVTPDSFSDGGKYASTDAALKRGLEMIREGADIIDVGGESTRPGAAPVAAEDEAARVLPVIQQLTKLATIPISVDTHKTAIASAALTAGASIVNDIGAGQADPMMTDLIRRSGAGYVAMHMQGTPGSMQDNPRYTDVVAEVRAYFLDILAKLDNARVSALQVVLDVGIGFGKRLEHNLELLARVRTFTELGRPLLLGVSRKSFIGKIVDAAVDARMPGGLAVASLAVEDGVAIIRTHDVAETVQALRVAEAVLNRRRA